MTQQQKRALIDRYLDAYNSFDVDAMMTTLHPEVEFENVSEGQVNAAASGASEFRQMAEQAKTLFTARRQIVTAFDDDGDGASIAVAYEGVLALDLPNGMRAGQRLKLDGRSEFAFKDGRISRIVDYS